MNLLEGLNEEAPSESIPWKDALNFLACKKWEVKTQPESVPSFEVLPKTASMPLKLQWWHAGMVDISQDA